MPQKRKRAAESVDLIHQACDPLPSGQPETSTRLDYFARLAKVKPSSTKFQELDVEVPDQSKIRKAIAKLPTRNINAKSALMAIYKRKFAIWRLQIKAGFNLLFYGLGSKRALINDFAEQFEGGGVMIVNGYMHSTTAKKIVLGVAKAMLDSSVLGPRRECDVLLDKIKSNPRSLYLVIHNIDGPRLRTQEDQALLAGLAACPNIHMVASVDHANSMMLWDMQVLSTLSWSMHNITTYAPYTEETLEMPCWIAGRGQEAERHGAAVVLRTLTQNAREVFLMLARHQLQDNRDGLPHHHLFRMCRERFLCSNEMTLKAHLNEFKDHGLVTVKKGTSGAELYAIPLLEDELERVRREFDSPDRA